MTLNMILSTSHQVEQFNPETIQYKKQNGIIHSFILMYDMHISSIKL